MACRYCCGDFYASESGSRRLCTACNLLYKWCPYCKQVRARDEFSKNRALRDGLAVHCTACRKVYRKRPAVACAHCGTMFERGQGDTRDLCGKCEHKRCSGCRQIKPFIEFAKGHADGKGGVFNSLSAQCRECSSVKRPCRGCGTIISGQHGQYCGECGLRHCIVCNEIKPEAEFVIAGKAKAGHDKYGWCKRCTRHRLRIANWERMYNLKLDMIVRMWQFQNGKCWFCFGSLDLWCDHGGACPESVCIDHDHDTAPCAGCSADCATGRTASWTRCPRCSGLSSTTATRLRCTALVRSGSTRECPGSPVVSRCPSGTRACAAATTPDHLTNDPHPLTTVIRSSFSSVRSTRKAAVSPAPPGRAAGGAGGPWRLADALHRGGA